MTRAILSIYKNIYFRSFDGLNHREVATLPTKMWPRYSLLGITLYTQYDNKYYSLK